MFERAILAGVVMLAVALPGGAQQGGDIEAQILYAFHTEDRHQLADLISGLQARSGAGRSDDSLRYHLAHAQYRLGRLLRAAHERLRPVMGLRPVMPMQPFRTASMS